MGSNRQPKPKPPFAKPIKRKAKPKPKPKPKPKSKPKKVAKDSKGKFIGGNNSNPEGGRAHDQTKKTAKTAMEQFLAAIERVEKKTGKNLFDHFVERALKNDTIMIALMKKRLPDLKAIEALVAEVPVDDETALAIQRKLRARFRFVQNETKQEDQ